MDLTGVKILVVDDEPDISELLECALLQYKAEVKIASSLNEAFHILESWCPDLLISDLMMPDKTGGSGFELISRVRNCEGKITHIPAIAISGLPKDEARTKALQLGFSLFVQKPILPDEFAEMIIRLMTTSTVSSK